ncbi:major capsid protein [Rhizobium johnstonii]|uniref:major capsid protein n=1 Tax=Rhizobium johnstonii TaxID=3019933 RepID=UPI003F97614A
MKVLTLNNPYDRVELTNAVIHADYIPHELETWLPWNSEGVTTRSIFIEVEVDGSLHVLDEANPRAGKKSYVDDSDVSGFTIRIPYYPQYDALIAEATQGKRAFGSADEAKVYIVELSKKIEKMKNKNALTREFIRSGAIQGVIYKRDGSVSQDLHALAGTTKTTHSFDLEDATTDVIAELTDAVEKVEDKLGAYQGLATSYKLIAGKNIHRKLSRHPTVREAFRLWASNGAVGNMGSALRDDLRAGFPITTNVDLVSYSKGKVGNTYFLHPDKAILCPIVTGLYQTRYAPGTGKDVVNTIGLPEYAQIEPLDFNKGDEIEVEMACVSYLERTEATCEITSSD